MRWNGLFGRHNWIDKGSNMFSIILYGYPSLIFAFLLLLMQIKMGFIMWTTFLSSY
jgi:hypothetical protein